MRDFSLPPYRMAYMGACLDEILRHLNLPEVPATMIINGRKGYGFKTTNSHLSRVAKTLGIDIPDPAKVPERVMGQNLQMFIVSLKQKGIIASDFLVDKFNYY